MKSPPPPKLTHDDIDEAHLWWNELPDNIKAHASIWNILALYAAHWAKVYTVTFEADVKLPRITEG